MNKQQRHSYKKKYNKFKKFINRDFPDYVKVYSLNEISGYYQVDFFLHENKLFNFAILPDDDYIVFKQNIESNIIQHDSIDKKCGICGDKTLMFCHCHNCFFVICIDCSDEIYIKNNCVYVCTKCNFTTPPPDISVSERLLMIAIRRYKSGLKPLDLYCGGSPPILFSSLAPPPQFSDHSFNVPIVFTLFRPSTNDKME